MKNHLRQQVIYWDLGSKENVSPVGCPSNTGVNRTSHSKRAMAPLQGTIVTIVNAEARRRDFNRKITCFSAGDLLESGGDLLSRAVTSQVPSALKGLTSVFGMGTGVTPSSLPPEMVSIIP